MSHQPCSIISPILHPIPPGEAGTTKTDQYKTSYSWNTNVSSECWNSNGTWKEGFALKVGESGRLAFQTKTGEFTRFGIRPLDPLQTYPGDDLILRFCKEDNFNKVTGDLITVPGTVPDNKKPTTVSAPGKSYLATYDKRLLWRANLYIAEEENDWNDLHPWNAPSGPVTTANNVPSGGIPWWAKKVDGSFDDRWGYNEWNRTWDGTGETEKGFLGLTSLAAGDGKQVITLPAFTPVRTLGGTVQVPNDKNVISGSVAYSYPYHRYEPFQASQGTAGDAGSQDSPFDFVKKMLLQKQQLGEWYNDKGDRFVKARSAWPDPQASSPDKFTTLNAYIQNAHFLAPTVVTEINSWIVKNPGKTWYQHQDISNFPLKPWTSTRAPKDYWWYYDATLPNGWDKTKVTKAFVPSLGLRTLTYYGVDNWKPTDIYDEKLHVPTTSLNAESYLNTAHVIEAGTDCIGFAQRAMSWKFNGQISKPIKNKYVWMDLGDGITEITQNKGTDILWDTLKTQTENKRRYPTETNSGGQPEAATTIVHTLPNFETNAFMKSDAWTAEEKTSALKLLKKVIPGDIWVKDSGDDNTLWDNHIAIVAQVPDNPDSYTDPQEYLNNIILIEGEFTYKIQSVIKKLSVGDYNLGKIPGPRKIYLGLLEVQDTKSIDLNTKSWAIKRLML